MDFAELRARWAHLAEASLPMSSYVEALSLERGEPRRTDEGPAIFVRANGEAVVGYTERGQFSLREVFATEHEACVLVWNQISLSAARQGPRAMPLRLADKTLAAEVAATSDAREITRYARHGDPAVRSNLASRTDLPPEVLRSLARDRDAWVAWVVARNPTTPEKVLVRLARSRRHTLMSRIVAQNPALTEELIDALVRDDDFGVRRQLARNARVPARFLTLLATDPDYMVRWSVGANPNTPADSLAVLARDEEMAVRLVVASNPVTESDELSRLAWDEAPDVRREVARNSRTPAPALAGLAADRETSVAIWVGKNAASDAAALTVLAGHPESYVRLFAAENPRTPADVLAVLRQDEWVTVREAAAR